MRQFIFFFILSIFFIVTNAQDSRITVGFEITPTFTALRGFSFNDYSMAKPGLSIGFSLEKYFSDRISIKSGLFYERKGTWANNWFYDSLQSQPQSETKNFDYLILPILGSLSTKGRFKIYINGGPYLGFLISQKNVYNAYDSIPAYTDNNYKNIKKLDLGLSMGIGFYIPFGDKFIFDLGLVQNLGLIHTTKNNVNKDLWDRTLSFGIQIGLKYKLYK
jgi:hypothetical protein